MYTLTHFQNGVFLLFSENHILMYNFVRCQLYETVMWYFFFFGKSNNKIWMKRIALAVDTFMKSFYHNFSNFKLEYLKFSENSQKIRIFINLEAFQTLFFRDLINRHYEWSLISKTSNFHWFWVFLLQYLCCGAQTAENRAIERFE